MCGDKLTANIAALSVATSASQQHEQLPTIDYITTQIIITAGAPGSQFDWELKHYLRLLSGITPAVSWTWNLSLHTKQAITHWN